MYSHVSFVFSSMRHRIVRQYCSVITRIRGVAGSHSVYEITKFIEKGELSISLVLWERGPYIVRTVRV